VPVATAIVVLPPALAASCARRIPPRGLPSARRVPGAGAWLAAGRPGVLAGRARMGVVQAGACGCV